MNLKQRIAQMMESHHIHAEVIELSKELFRKTGEVYVNGVFIKLI